MASHASEAWLRALKLTAPITESPSVILPTVVAHLAERFGLAPAFVSSTTCWSYRALGERVDHYTHWALTQGLGGGDVVCLLMKNCPDYMAIWLGITRVGCIVSLMNTNLRGQALEHSIKLVSPRHIVIGEGMHEAFSTMPQFDPGICCWAHGAHIQNLPRIDLDTEIVSPYDARQFRMPSLRDTALYIYTSGTTGLPKAAPISHFRLMQWTHWFAGMMDTGANDRMYNCLPMYHSVGGIVATGATLIGGGAVVIRERFSANRFWADVAQSDCTLFQYTGELCRYLVNSPPDSRETEHGLRLCCGNGLSGSVWQTFQTRFHIPRIIEFYASTEGNLSLYNCEERPGAIGRIPPFLAHRFPIELVKFDAESGLPERDEEGFCLRCDPKEAGHAITRISGDSASLSGRFEGYADPAETEKKILRDVFVRGDAWFLTGDLMRKDERGYYYFVDRVGDTFRWKGENVSTMETAEIVAACAGVTDAVVYGVEVPHHEGRAGMAAIVADETLDLKIFYAALSESLPPYARPVFLRVCSQIDRTATFKPQKQHFRREGYNPSDITDALYFNDREKRAFVALDPFLFDLIQSGSVRL